ncbi:MAG TPA: hypothetical protein VFE44_07215 [Thermoanaerobaculia bacterium]|nr:hypothetical protein [Thermoanaerobaculia bacterium]
MAAIHQIHPILTGDRTRSALIICAKAIVIAALGLILGGGFAKFATTAVDWLAPVAASGAGHPASPSR